MIKEYRSVYNFLSNDAHNNIRALVNRYLEIGENDFTVVYYKDEALEGFLQTLDSTAAIVIEVSSAIHEYFETGKDKIIEQLDQELAEIRNEY